MKNITQLSRLLLCILLSVQLGSCGLLDFDVDEQMAEFAAHMRLNYDTVYVMRGDTFSIVPIFKPDTINSKLIFIQSSDTNVVAVRDTYIEAKGAGKAKLTIQSLSAQISDSCTVIVHEPWMPDNRCWPYETIFYTEVKVNDKPLTSDMTVAAFVGNECRAIGQVLKYHNKTVVQFRVGSEELYTGGDKEWVVDDAPDPEKEDDGDDEEDDEEDEDEEEDIDDEDDEETEPDTGHWVEPYAERIRFRCYDRLSHKLYVVKDTTILDGETYGSLSQPYKVYFKK